MIENILTERFYSKKVHFVFRIMDADCNTIM